MLIAAGGSLERQRPVRPTCSRRLFGRYQSAAAAQMSSLLPRWVAEELLLRFTMLKKAERQQHFASARIPEPARLLLASLE